MLCVVMQVIFILEVFLFIILYVFTFSFKLYHERKVKCCALANIMIYHYLFNILTVTIYNNQEEELNCYLTLTPKSKINEPN